MQPAPADDGTGRAENAFPYLPKQPGNYKRLMSLRLPPVRDTTKKMPCASLIT
jgi:hypothetical protein